MGAGRAQGGRVTGFAATAPGDSTYLQTSQREEESNAEPSNRTPLYAALSADRCRRQDLIREIQTRSQFRLISYVSSGSCLIEHDGAIYFRDLLHRIHDNEDIELMLHTPGGDIDAAEKLILMIRTPARRP